MPDSRKPLKSGRPFSGWSIAVILLALVIIAGGTVIFLNLQNRSGIEIALTPEKPVQGAVFINGGVNNPGLYPVFSGDTLEDVIRAAGGLKDGAGLGQIALNAAASDAENTGQKININRAQIWLLEALPGIGEVKAQAIIDYRTEHGFFHDPAELLNVPGFSHGVLDKIKDFITVYD